jgi:citrate lyase subunit beta/citryl-CoA lyase
MGGPASHRPGRLILYLPASNERAMAKAATHPVDSLILDLEDAVPPAAREAARAAACAAVGSTTFGRREVAIRVNGVGTGWHGDDLAADYLADPDAILVPKVASADRCARWCPRWGPFGA